MKVARYGNGHGGGGSQGSDRQAAIQMDRVELLLVGGSNVNEPFPSMPIETKSYDVPSPSKVEEQRTPVGISNLRSDRVRTVKFATQFSGPHQRENEEVRGMNLSSDDNLIRSPSWHFTHHQ